MVTKANSFVSSRGSLFVAMAATAAVLGLGSVTQGATMTYTPPSTSTDLWNAGTDWSATPVTVPFETPETFQFHDCVATCHPLWVRVSVHGA